MDHHGNCGDGICLTTVYFLQSDLWPGLKNHCIIIFSVKEEIKLIGLQLSSSAQQQGFALCQRNY